MKNIKTILSFCHMVKRFGYHNCIQMFNLKKVPKVDYNSAFYSELYTGLSSPKSTLQFRIGSQKLTDAITYDLYDTVLNRTVACFSLASMLQHTTMYSEWLSVNYKSDRFFVNTNSMKTDSTEEVYPSIGEDEHFQMMMLHDAPEYENMKDAFKYVQEVYPLLKTYKFHSLVTYDSLDVDFSKHIPHEEVLTEMEIQFPGILEFYKGAETSDSRSEYLP